ncbi:MAG: hypothetical protein GTN76_01130 [Candidatus Aenigmarchaeota archaeon]|nr:hypothetical protein [Candidatus Aenigmarchaeota archaeon]
MIKNVYYVKKISLFFLIAVSFILSCADKPHVKDFTPTVAVWDLDYLGPAGSVQPDLGEVLSNQIMVTIQKTGKYSVIERERLFLAFEELHLGTTSLVEERTRLQLGKISGAQFMVFGGYQVVGKTMRLDLRLVEVGTGRVRKAVQKTTAADDIAGWLDSARIAAEELL